MPEPAAAGADRVRAERRFVAGFLLAVSLVLAHFIHSAWYAVLQISGASSRAVRSASVPAVRYAPDAYRVAMPAVLHLLARMLPAVDPLGIATGVDFCCAFAALYLLYLVAVWRLPADVNRERRLLTVGLFLAFLQFPLAWVVPWQRPETLPSALFLAVAMVCCARGSEPGRSYGVWTLLLLAAAAVQAFVRSDVPMAFGLGLGLASLSPDPRHSFGSRRWMLLHGAAVFLIAAGAQAWLQFGLYPHLAYPPGTNRLQIRDNLVPHNLETALVALLPFLGLGVFLLRRSVRLGGVEAVAVASAAVYLPLWFVFGNIAEVRIYVPFLLLLSVVAARTLPSALEPVAVDPADRVANV